MLALYVLWLSKVVYLSVLVLFLPQPFEIIHCDIWGRYQHPSLFGVHYFLTIVDDYTRFTWIFLMQHKNEAQSLLKRFFSYVFTQFESRIKLFEVTMVANLSHFVLFFKIMVSSFSSLAFICLDKMGLWNANIIIFYKWLEL